MAGFGLHLIRYVIHVHEQSYHDLKMPESHITEQLMAPGYTHKESYMSAHVLLKLLNELGKRYKI